MELINDNFKFFQLRCLFSLRLVSCRRKAGLLRGIAERELQFAHQLLELEAGGIKKSR